MTSLSVVIVTYNSRATIDACLAALTDLRPDWEVIVVDNNSNDDTVSVIRGGFPWVNVMCNSTNDGFGVACNRAAAMARGERILFLNPDCRIDPNAVDDLLRTMQFPGVAAAGPVIFSPSGRMLSVGENFLGLRELFVNKILVSRRWRRLKRPSHTGPVDWVTGAALMVNKCDFEAIGGFDPRYWLYVEDMDLCWRLRQLGRTILVVPEAVAWHIHSHSVSSNMEAALQSYSRGMLRWFALHFRPGRAFCGRLLLIAALGVQAIFGFLTKPRRWTGLRAYARAAAVVATGHAPGRGKLRCD